MPEEECTRVAGRDGNQEEARYRDFGPNPGSQGELRSDLQLKIHSGCSLGWETGQKPCLGACAIICQTKQWSKTILSRKDLKCYLSLYPEQ